MIKIDNLVRELEGYMEELIELALKKIDVLEKKLERYYAILRVDNELDFILKGTYVLQEQFDNIMSGEY